MSRLWGNAFLPSRYQGVRFRSGGGPVLYLADPPGIDRGTRRRLLDTVAQLNRIRHETFGDPEIDPRIAQYEMAYRMQASLPHLMDLSDEPAHTFELHGPDSRKPGTYAANCLLARRLAERGVRFIQLYHRGWDQHFDLPRDISLQCKGVDQGSAAKWSPRSSPDSSPHVSKPYAMRELEGTSGRLRAKPGAYESTSTPVPL